jgi:hypothetical protein
VFNLRGEAVAVNRYTIESYQNVGGTLFPFQRIDGAQVTKGACGTFAACPFMDVIAFVGGGRNEPVSVYLGADGAYRNVSTHEIDTILEGYSERQLASVEVEARTDKAHRLLYIHLPDRTLVYDAAASEALGEPVWFVLVSTLDGFERYRARGMVYAGGQWTAGDPASAAVGVLSDDVSSHWGEPVRWEFGTPIVYNEAAGAIFNELELIALTGNAAVGANPVISTSYSLDGVEWSSDRTICAGRTGDRNKRLVWFGQGFMRKWRIQRFRGTSDAHMSVARLEARLEPLAY